MKLSDLSFFSGELLQFSCDDPSSNWQQGEAVQIHAHGDDYLIRQGDSVCVATALGSQYRVAIQVQRDLTLWLLRSQNKNILQIQWLDLVERIQMDMSITVDEAIAEHLAGNGEITSANVPLAVAWLTNHFISLDESSGSPSTLGQLFLGHFDNHSESAFVIFGSGWRGIIKQDKGTLKLQSVTRLKGTTEQLAMAFGSINFQDASVAVRLQSSEQRALLDAALRDNGSYLRLWQEYGELEWEQAKDRARELGSLSYKKASLIEGERWAWFLTVDAEPLKAFKRRWNVLDQAEISDRELDLDEVGTDKYIGVDKVWRRPIRGLIHFERDGVILKPNQNQCLERPSAKGYINFSLSGDETVQNRRAKAKKDINDGRRLPQLRYLLEGVAPSIARRRQVVGLSPYAKACFKGPPTDRQKLALQVAINTPDIALIVGPPGTGKTQVIAALQRRLAETLGEQSLQHQVLISSYQHDAVDNALNRAVVFGLPAVRIGRRGRRDEGGVDPVTVWCERKRKEIFNRLDSLKQQEPLAQPLANIDRKITTLRLARLTPKERQVQFEQLNSLIQQIEHEGINLSPEVKDRWGEFLAYHTKVEKQRSANEPMGLLRLIRALRTTPIAFSDDGPDRVYQLDRALKRTGIDLENNETELLLRLSNSGEVTEKDLLDLISFKNSMIDRLIPDYRPPLLKQALNDDALGILTDIQHAIIEPLSQSRKGISTVIESYHAALAQDPETAERTIREYASIVGATCQQSACKDMSNLKELSNLESMNDIEFDTVVIDEAARANPLDLFVPMAMARRRIILVGDHRQLPHLVQRELEDELITRQCLTEAQAKAYEQSLFERLVKQLREQEKVDNIQRVVMLDTQFRMHPTLGDFISQQFYEPVGLGILYSGCPASDFNHEIPGYKGKCAAWLDVPLTEGKEDKQGSSRMRQAEANLIAQEVKRIADFCGPTVSIGVISFYSAQRDLILKAMINQGLAEYEDDAIRIVRSYRQTDIKEERLRVGTVDAFQGKEFDVVLLSIVRANDKKIPSQKEGVERDRLLNGKYGHLRLANRLNVAVSRQRKLLIAVGDMNMAQGSEAEEAVPALAGFLNLCRMENRNGR